MIVPEQYMHGSSIHIELARWRKSVIRNHDVVLIRDVIVIVQDTGDVFEGYRTVEAAWLDDALQQARARE